MKRTVSVLGASVIWACSSPATDAPLRATLADTTGLRLSVSSPVRSSSDDLSWSGEITNESSDVTHLEFGACGLEIYAFREGRQEAAWYSAHRGPVIPERGPADVSFVCPAYLAVLDVAPGETVAPREFALAVPVGELLGDSLPEGRYLFEAWFELNGGRVGPLRLGEGTVRR